MYVCGKVKKRLKHFEYDPMYLFIWRLWFELSASHLQSRPFTA
jgi:hypothetical protein